MKLTINTVRPSRYFKQGDKGYMLDTQEGVGTPKQIVDKQIQNLKAFGRPWTQTKFVPFVVVEMAEGSFEFKAESKLLMGGR